MPKLPILEAAVRHLEPLEKKNNTLVHVSTALAAQLQVGSVIRLYRSSNLLLCEAFVRCGSHAGLKDICPHRSTQCLIAVNVGNLKVLGVFVGS